MIIPLDKNVLHKNFIDDANVGSLSGDIILIQDTGNVERSYIDDLINYFNENLPLESNLLNDNRLKSKQKPEDNKILGAHIFKNFSVNGKKFDSESYFITYIREKLSGKKKITFCLFLSTKLEEWNVDNLAVINDLSNAINEQGFRVDALNYIKSEDRLDFIANIYGPNATTSEVFYDNKRHMRKLNDFPKSKIRLWSDLQFAVNCLDLIEKYDLTEKFQLLTNNYYCKKRFKLNKIISKRLNENETELYSNEKFYFNNERYHVLSSWDDNRKLFWDWLLDCISEVSDDVIPRQVNNINFLRLPIDYIDNLNDSDEINIKFKITSDDSNKNVDEENESNVTVSPKNSKFQKNYRKYFVNQVSEQRLFFNQEVLIVDPFLTKFHSCYLFKIRAIKEQEIILDKGNGFINKDKRETILNMIRRGDFDG